MTKKKCHLATPVLETYNVLHAGRLEETTGTHILETTGIRPRQVYGVIIQNDPDSANSIHVGDQYQQTFEIVAGGALTLPIDRLERVYITFSGAATVNWIAVG